MFNNNKKKTEVFVFFKFYFLFESIEKVEDFLSSIHQEIACCNSPRNHLEKHFQTDEKQLNGKHIHVPFIRTKKNNN